MKNRNAFFMLQYVLLLGMCRTAYAQRHNYNYKSGRRNYDDYYPSGVSMSLGANHFITDKTNFDAWTNSTCHKIVPQLPVGFNLDMTFMGKYADGGFHLQYNSPFSLSTLFIGTNLIRTPHFRSFLNAEVGFFEAEAYHVSPPNYVPTQAQQGKSLYLEYETGSVGLSLKNVFVSRPNEAGTSFISSIDVQFGYMPWRGQWEYGYYSGKHFHGAPVSGIPPLSNMCFSITYSIGFLTRDNHSHR